MIRCLRCKKQTMDTDIKTATAKNGRPMVKAVCSVCGAKKSQFVSSGKGKGILSFLL